MSQQYQPPQVEIEAVLDKLATQKILGCNIRHQRGRSQQDLADLEMKGEERDKVIFDLVLSDFCHCLEGDAGFGRVFVFGVNRIKVEIYIKLGDLEKPPINCISFHKSDHPLKYPYRDAGTPAPRNQHNQQKAPRASRRKD